MTESGYPTFSSLSNPTEPFFFLKNTTAFADARIHSDFFSVNH